MQKEISLQKRKRGSVSLREGKMSTNKKVSDIVKTVLWYWMMAILMVGSIFVILILREGMQNGSFFSVLPVVLLLIGTFAYAGIFERKVTKGLLYWLIPVVYVISFTLLLLVNSPLAMPFWCFGGVLLLCAFRIRYGMFLNYFFLVLAESIQPHTSPEILILHVLCLLLLGIVMPYAKNWKDTVNILISLIAVIISVRIVCFLIFGKEQLSDDIFCITAVYTVVVVAALFFSKLLLENNLVQTQKESYDFLEELAVSAEEHDADILESLIAVETAAENKQREEKSEPVWMVQEKVQEAPERQNGTDGEVRLKELCMETAPLLVQLSKDDTGAFLHADRVARFALEIAERLEGVDALLVKCGGYYHEIGRLRGKNTLENTLEIAKQEAFPVALQDILREHTINGDKPTSKEAAVLLLTDNVCSMCEYLKKTQKGKILVVKIIDKALNLRISKEDLSESGLTVKEFAIIRNTMAEIMKEEMF